jgi:hypothetical protein
MHFKILPEIQGRFIYMLINHMYGIEQSQSALDVTEEKFVSYDFNNLKIT